MAREPQATITQQAAAELPGSKSIAQAEKPASKASLVVELLQRQEGVTITQLTEATGWLPHTARAALTGLRKKGHTVTNTKAAGEDRVYRVVAD